jgi:putative copper resistance protein D
VQGCVSLRFRPAQGVTPTAFLLTLLLFAFLPSGCSNNHDAHGLSYMAPTHGGDHHVAPSSDEAIDTAKRLADKQESEFNHHLAGLFIAIAGVLILAQERLARQWPLAKYAWPFCFLLAGLFVLLFSDTEIWPWGTQSLYYALAHNPEDVQHKAFALILILVAWFEIQSLRGQSNAAWSVWAFPALSLVGAILLLFHSHETGMDGPNAMAVMERIEWQHRWYASIGFGVALTKGLSETRIRCGPLLRKTWPLLLIVLGTSLTLYTE